MSGFLLMMLLAQAPAMPSLPLGKLVWGQACDLQPVDTNHRIDRAVRELLAKADLPPAQVARCIQPPRASFAAFLSDRLENGMFLLIYNAEGKRFFSDKGIRGLVAHEVAHEMLETSCRGANLTIEQSCEFEVDHAAAQLVGAETMQTALEEYHRLHIHLAAYNLAGIRERLDVRIQRLHGDAP